jgi:type 1 glutamine amidotransferase
MRMFRKIQFVSAAVAVVAASTYVGGQAAQPAPAGQGQPAGAAQAQAPGAPAPAAPGGRGAGRGGRGGGGGQWGSGPIRVAVITKGHPFGPIESFYGMFNSFGTDISWSSVEHPAAQVMLQPKYSDLFDVYVFYDIGGGRGGSTQAAAGAPAPVIPKDAKIEGTRWYPPPPAELKAEFPKLLRQGNKGFVFMHHSNASYVHSWPEYSEVVGSACDWGQPSTVRGVEHPPMGFYGNTPQKITIVDKTHPITKDVSDFEITDESYNCVFFEDSVHALARTDFVAANAKGRNGGPGPMLNPKVPSSNLVAYVKTAETSPVAYIQMGHGAAAWDNPEYRKLLLNAIKWAASPESKAWAKANPKKIFP